MKLSPEIKKLYDIYNTPMFYAEDTEDYIYTYLEDYNEDEYPELHKIAEKLLLELDNRKNI